MSSSNSDIVLIGAGVIGLTTALKLAERGVSVTLLDRQATGLEASWAGAGMLPPGNLAKAATPEARLRSYSHSLWNDLATELFQRTGIDNGYHICGAVQVFTAESQSEFEQRCCELDIEGIRAQRLCREDAEKLVTDLNPTFDSAVYIPEFGQVHNPRHLQALKKACFQQGVEIFEYAEGIQLCHNNDRIISVSLPGRKFSFARVCITAGAWSASILESLGFVARVKPMRGQIVQLQLPAQPFRCVIELGRRYLVPRRDGLILIGSTEEDVGFVKQNTPDGIVGLLAFARTLVPSLSHAQVVRSWSGLRPGSPDELPFLGAVPGFSNLFLGAGHFRSGLQMSPGTATILADLMLGIAPAISLGGLTVGRFAQEG